MATEARDASIRALSGMVQEADRFHLIEAPATTNHDLYGHIPDDPAMMEALRSVYDAEIIVQYRDRDTAFITLGWS